MIRIIGSYFPKSEPTEYDEIIEQIQQRMMTLIEDSTKAECADEIFDKEYRVIANEIKGLKKKRLKSSGSASFRNPTTSGCRIWKAT